MSVYITLSANPTKRSKTLKLFVGNSYCHRIFWVSLTFLWGWRLKEWWWFLMQLVVIISPKIFHLLRKHFLPASRIFKSIFRQLSHNCSAVIPKHIHVYFKVSGYQRDNHNVTLVYWKGKLSQLSFLCKNTDSKL